MTSVCCRSVSLAFGCLRICVCICRCGYCVGCRESIGARATWTSNDVVSSRSQRLNVFNTHCYSLFFFTMFRFVVSLYMAPSHWRGQPGQDTTERKSCSHHDIQKAQMVLADVLTVTLMLQCCVCLSPSVVYNVMYCG